MDYFGPIERKLYRGDEVYHIYGTSVQKQNWLRYWEDQLDKNARTCAENNCHKPATDGARVQPGGGGGRWSQSWAKWEMDESQKRHCCSCP